MGEAGDASDPAPAAAILAEAWRSGAWPTELPEAVRPRTMAEGYDVQDRLIAGLGHPVAGWKPGVGGALRKRRSGVGRSIAGRILGSRLHRPGDTVPLPNAAPAAVEFEIAHVLGRDVPPGEAAFPVLEAVGEVRVAFEVVPSRFTDRRAVGWPSFAADDGAFQALVLGDPLDPARLGEPAAGLVVTLDGEEAARASTGEDATDPEAALADLVATARERGMVLPGGSIVSTGTVSKPFDVAAPSAEVRARFCGVEMGFCTRVGRGNAA